MKRSASARWNGDIMQGRGTVGTESGVLAGTPYSFHARFGSGTGSNPEELIAAAHAGCFSMALSGFLASAGQAPTQIDTTATARLVSSKLSADGSAKYVDGSRATWRYRFLRA